MADVATKPLRADARRNRKRIIEAARSMLAESGFLTQMDDLAERAEISVGTIYRHFPSKDHLIGQLVAERCAEFTSEMEVAWGQIGAGREPREALFDALWRCAEISARDCSVQDALLRASDRVMNIARPATDELHRMGAKLVEAAVLAGTLRPDATSDDVYLLMTGVMATQSPRCPTSRLNSWRRHLELSLDGLRARP